MDEPIDVRGNVRGKPIEIRGDETFTVRVTMPPIPCARCGLDLRGRRVFPSDPRTEEREGRRVAVCFPVCEACATSFEKAGWVTFGNPAENPVEGEKPFCFGGFLRDPALCSDAACPCHVDEAHAVRTPFPDHVGTCRSNPYCCSRCALVVDPGVGRLSKG